MKRWHQDRIKRKEGERERERKGASRSREFILTSFDSPSLKEWEEQAPARGANADVGEDGLLDKSHYSPLAFTTHAITKGEMQLWYPLDQRKPVLKLRLRDTRRRNRKGTSSLVQWQGNSESSKWREERAHHVSILVCVFQTPQGSPESILEPWSGGWKYGVGGRRWPGLEGSQWSKPERALPSSDTCRRGHVQAPRRGWEGCSSCWRQRCSVHTWPRMWGGGGFSRGKNSLNSNRTPPLDKVARLGNSLRN